MRWKPSGPRKTAATSTIDRPASDLSRSFPLTAAARIPSISFAVGCYLASQNQSVVFFRNALWTSTPHSRTSGERRLIEDSNTINSFAVISFSGFRAYARLLLRSRAVGSSSSSSDVNACMVASVAGPGSVSRSLRLRRLFVQLDRRIAGSRV